MRSLVRFQVAPPANETLRGLVLVFGAGALTGCQVVNRTPSEHAQVMKLIRGAISALLLAATFASVLRVRGTGGTPPQHGGWRPLELPER